MTVEEIVTKLNLLLMTNDYPVLYEYDGLPRATADQRAVTEYGKFKQSILPEPKHK